MAGENYAQGSHWEHAAMAPRSLGQKVILARSYARIGIQNLVNFRIIPFVFENPGDYEELERGQYKAFDNITDAVNNNRSVMTIVQSTKQTIPLHLELTPRQGELILEGGLFNQISDHA